MGQILRFLPSLAAFLVAGGLELSGIEIPWLGYSVMVFGGLLLLIPAWPWVKRLRLQSPVKVLHTPKLSTLPDPPKKLPQTEFHARRPEYGVFRQHVESATEIWACWHVGSSAKNYGLFRTGRIKRLLLAFPNNAEIPALADITHIDADLLRKTIYEAAQEAQKWGVEVKWWEGHVVDPFTIGDPTKSGSTWVITEHVVPYEDADQRPGIYITDTQVCDRYREAFTQMWNNRPLTMATLGLSH